MVPPLVVYCCSSLAAAGMPLPPPPAAIVPPRGHDASCCAVLCCAVLCCAVLRKDAQNKSNSTGLTGGPTGHAANVENFFFTLTAQNWPTCTGPPCFVLLACRLLWLPACSLSFCPAFAAVHAASAPAAVSTFVHGKAERCPKQIKLNRLDWPPHVARWAVENFFFTLTAPPAAV